MGTDQTKNTEELEELQRGYNELINTVDPHILEPKHLNHKKLMSLVGRRFPGQPCLVSVSQKPSLSLIHQDDS